MTKTARLFVPLPGGEKKEYGLVVLPNFGFERDHTILNIFCCYLLHQLFFTCPFQCRMYSKPDVMIEIFYKSGRQLEGTEKDFGQ